eukprot:scaffold6164_cov163-Amphora_coffeaeformis.AAC.21
MMRKLTPPQNNNNNEKSTTIGIRPSYTRKTAGGIALASLLLLQLQQTVFVTTTRDDLSKFLLETTSFSSLSNSTASSSSSSSVSILAEPGHKKQQRPLAFVHIPKTGGTAITAAGAQAGLFWGQCHLSYKPDKRPCPSYHFTSHGGSQETIVGYKKANIIMSSAGLAKASPYHVPPAKFPGYCTYTQTCPEARNDTPAAALLPTWPYAGYDLFAVIRNPYTRIISEYYFVMKYHYPKKVKKNPAALNDPKRLNHFIQKRLKIFLKECSAWQKPRSCMMNADGHFIPQTWYIFDKHNQHPKIIHRPHEQKIVHHVLRYERLHEDFGALMQQYGIPATLPKENTENVRISKANLGVANLTKGNIQLIQQLYQEDFEFGGYSLDPLKAV